MLEGLYPTSKGTGGGGGVVTPTSGYIHLYSGLIELNVTSQMPRIKYAPWEWYDGTWGFDILGQSICPRISNPHTL